MGFVYIDMPTLDGLCNHVYTQFSSNVKELRKIYDEWHSKGNAGGISDITLFKSFLGVNPDLRIMLNDTEPSGGCVFVNMFDSKAFRHRGKYVDLIRDGSEYYVYNYTNNRLKALGVHLYGVQKKYMRKYYSGAGAFRVHLTYLWKESLFHRILVFMRNHR